MSTWQYAGQSLPATPPAETFHACTFNTWRNLPNAAVRADLRRVYARCDVVALQETYVRPRAVLAARGWHVARPVAAIPIAYRVSRWVRLGAGHVAGSAGNAHVGARTVTWVRLRARTTGAVLTVVDVHEYPHVEVRGHPRRLPRLALYVRMLANTARLVARADRAGRVLVLGDFNVDANADWRVRWHGFPTAWAHRHRLTRVWDATAPPRVGTLGRRAVDMALSRNDGGLWPVSRQILRRFHSDHNPLLVTYRLTRG